MRGKRDGAGVESDRPGVESDGSGVLLSAGDDETDGAGLGGEGVRLGGRL